MLAQAIFFSFFCFACAQNIFDRYFYAIKNKLGA